MNILVDGQTLHTPEVHRGIGIYFKNVLNNMIKFDVSNRWYISISNIEVLNELDEWVREKIIPIVNDAFNPMKIHKEGFDFTNQYTIELNNVIEKYNIDVLWNPNPLMVNVFFQNSSLKCRQFITIYDLIPFIFEVYRKAWTKEVNIEYDRRLDYIKNQGIEIIAISDCTKKDIKKHLNISSERIHVAYLAADSRKFYRKLIRKKNNNAKPVIVYTGGFDMRKNLHNAIKSFAKAKKQFREDGFLASAILYIICSCSEQQKIEVEQYIDKLDMTGNVMLTGYISDQELSDLYFDADLFFFPSMYEGFGLPLLEAMLTGTYVLAGDNSSLPEVVKEYGLFCNVNDIEDMAFNIQKALTISMKEELSEKISRQKYALEYTWEKTAIDTLKIIYSFGIVNEQTNNGINKTKLAVITPWPPQKTGIANYIYNIVPYLGKYFNVDIFVDDSQDKEKHNYFENKCGCLYMIEQFKEVKNNYDHILYQLGNNSLYHTGIYDLANEIPGIIEIHDYNIHPFMYHSYFLKKRYNVYKEALANGYGEEGLKHYQNVKDGIAEPNIAKYPMIHHISNISKGVIVHNHWSYKQLESTSNRYVIQLAAFNVNSCNLEDTQMLKNKLNIGEEFIIGCFGFVNDNKRPLKTIEATGNLINKGYPVKLMFFGENSSKVINDYIIEHNLEKSVKITGYLDNTQYETALDICDIVINLRYPSMGESSATLCEALKSGKAIIVSNFNQYKEFPDDVCWKVDIGPKEVNQIENMVSYLLENKLARKALGENAKEYADEILSPEKIAYWYYNSIKKVYKK